MNVITYILLNFFNIIICLVSSYTLFDSFIPWFTYGDLILYIPYNKLPFQTKTSFSQVFILLFILFFVYSFSTLYLNFFKRKYSKLTNAVYFLWLLTFTYFTLKSGFFLSQYIFKFGFTKIRILGILTFIFCLILGFFIFPFSIKRKDYIRKLLKGGKLISIPFIVIIMIFGFSSTAIFPGFSSIFVEILITCFILGYYLYVGHLRQRWREAYGYN